MCVACQVLPGRWPVELTGATWCAACICPIPAPHNGPPNPDRFLFPHVEPCASCMHSTVLPPLLPIHTSSVWWKAAFSASHTCLGWCSAPWGSVRLLFRGADPSAWASLAAVRLGQLSASAGPQLLVELLLSSDGLLSAWRNRPCSRSLQCSATCVGAWHV